MAARPIPDEPEIAMHALRNGLNMMEAYNDIFGHDADVRDSQADSRSGRRNASSG